MCGIFHQMKLKVVTRLVPILMNMLKLRNLWRKKLISNVGSLTSDFFLSFGNFVYIILDSEIHAYYCLFSDFRIERSLLDANLHVWVDVSGWCFLHVFRSQKGWQIHLRLSGSRSALYFFLLLSISVLVFSEKLSEFKKYYLLVLLLLFPLFCFKLIN